MIPDADELAEVLLDLAVPHEDIDELIALRRALTADAGAMRLLEECAGELVRDMGQIVDYGDGLQLRERVTEAPAGLGGHFATYVFVAALPHTRAYHRARGVPADVSRRTLTDLGRHMALHRRRHGRGGVQSPQWLVLHFRGELYQLGRLQFQRAQLWRRAALTLGTAGFDGTAGTPCLDIHIPEFLGPLTPAACDRSLALAREFFALHHPEEPYRAAMCHSWLLDPQLKKHLPADSNIVRFQERFRIARRDSEPADREPVQFVFGDPELPVAGLPRRTTLERAIGDHLRAGGHWYIGRGWLPL
ncbi:acyltransferase domain-containing protein [Streptomyces sp. S.PB5]|uniref:acyltransferase domain-containing protein n=1 Tax=Streptomyces sp. S.PB5 TaxID=3020844 RepID=UPI0025B1D119|nr:acyltransferase domain-containing protein [Streptomyces sp. S.PB5]MDN3020965.1 acyltransferase domain-containing protein [Streptomyces sp. S.PB5]